MGSHLCCQRFEPALLKLEIRCDLLCLITSKDPLHSEDLADLPYLGEGGLSENVAKGARQPRDVRHREPSGDGRTSLCPLTGSRGNEE